MRKLKGTIQKLNMEREEKCMIWGPVSCWVLGVRRTSHYAGYWE